MIETNKIIKIINDVLNEMIRATSLYNKMNSAHEGYAIIEEEFDELWKNIKLKQSNPNRKRLMKEEAIHVGAMVIRFLYDCCTEEE